MKNHESQSRTNESQLKKRVKLKMLGQTVNLKTDSKTLCYSILKLKSSLSGLDISTNTHVQINQLIFVSYGTHATNYFVYLGLFIPQGRRMQR